MLTSMMLAGCSTSEDVDHTYTGKKLYELVKINLNETEKKYVERNNDFAFKLFKNVSEMENKEPGFLVSPLSVTYVLGMLNNGAAGTTREEINSVLGFGNGDAEAVNNFCRKLLTGSPNVDKSVKINIANLVEVRKDCKLKPAFKQTVEEAYDARVESADFDDPGTVTHINDWCAKQTNGMIPQVLDRVSPETVALLLNAIYFKGVWYSQFKPRNTRNEVFTMAGGKQSEVPMMHQRDIFLYNTNETYATLSMSYGNGGYRMLVLLPNDGKTTDDVLEAINSDKWIPNLNGLRNYQVDVKLPRFETSTKTNLNEVLKALGAGSMFDGYKADFSNFCELSAHVSKIFQCAKIKVNEEGSEAAAVTVGGMETTAPGMGEIPTAVFHANRPFIYAITENTTGSIYFIGVYGGDGK